MDPGTRQAFHGAQTPAPCSPPALIPIPADGVSPGIADRQEQPLIDTVIHWFRRDLRLADNSALRSAAATGHVLPVFILDTRHGDAMRTGSASRWWLRHSLLALDRRLGGRLRVAAGDPLDLLPALAQQAGARAVYWNRCYEPWQITRDRQLKAALREQDIEAHSSNGSLLWEPWQVHKDNGDPYRVFTPYYRRGCLGHAPPRHPLPEPDPLPLVAAGDREQCGRTAIETLGLLPDHPWYEKLEAHWAVGEESARQRLDDFLANGLDDYREGRNFPARPNTSRLSAALHFGELSPHQVWHAASEEAFTRGLESELDCFQSELGWREFSYYQLYHNPELPAANLQPKFDQFPWLDRPELRRAWQGGRTGIPLVDAGMRELWQTGYLHNRVRMVVASFLTKNLMQHWQHGERWFRNTLVDADLASNCAGWQWVAGCGLDAAPYFRIFNPATQSRRFDQDGAYIRQYVPELVALPDRHLHAPWEAPARVLEECGVRLGRDYPAPIVDLKQSRAAALEAFKSISG
jgi:deoxyribodipyrimidine photo-lyase